MRASRVSVTGTATLLVSADAAIGTKYTDGSTLNVRNRGSAAVYVGGSDVTSAAGYKLDAGESLSWDLGIGDSMYAITAGTTEEVHVLQGHRVKRSQV